jgi:predicted secreted Zn-dependent protease
MRYAIALAALLLATAAAAQPPAAVAPAAKFGSWVRFYDVEGIEYKSLLASLNSRGPGGFHGYAKWHVAYTYRTAAAPGRCSVAAVEAKLTADILMPRWPARHGAAGDLVARWQRYEAALIEHEEGHIAHGRELARTLEAELPRVPAAADCRALDAAVRARFDVLLKDYVQRDRDYDARTGHGRTQGAVFR